MYPGPDDGTGTIAAREPRPVHGGAIKIDPGCVGFVNRGALRMLYYKVPIPFTNVLAGSLIFPL